MKSRLILVAGVVAASACARSYAELSPAAGSTPASPGPGEGAVASVANVSVTARTQAWHFDPPDLETKATPVLLEFNNNSDRAIVVRYDHIVLTDAAGHRLDVIPPYNVEGKVSVPVTVQQPYYFGGYTYAPYVGRFSPTYMRYNYINGTGGFAYDPQYYQPYVTVYTDIALPTPEMLQRALPEGAIESGGAAGGFVYFKKIGRGEQVLTLHVAIIDQASNDVLGIATIPFVAH
ncbi:MAG TPA: hypothetical protein VGQ44_08710 [Gemmatimonadaceae bacterium]|nr:hypothetical protein [Gemmatimonadaceae bacterium]